MRGSSTLRAAVGIVLALAVVLVATVLVRLLLDDGSGAEVTESTSAAARDAVVVDPAVAEEVVAVAEEAAAQVLGYSWRTLDSDAMEARFLLADEVREQYDVAMARGADRTLRTRTVVEATPVASSVVAVTRSEAKVLLFVNERTTATDLGEPRVELTRVVLTLRHTDDGWQVAEIDSL